MDVIGQASRSYLPTVAALGDRQAVASYFDELASRSVADVGELQQWLKDQSELDAALSEEGAWRYIRMTLDTRNEVAATAYQAFVNEVLPLAEEAGDKLNRKLMALPFAEQVSGEGFGVYFRGIREQLRIFREANVPLQTELRNMAQTYSTTIGAMQVEWKGETITLPKAAAILESTDRNEREAIFRLIAARRLNDADTIDALFTDMVALRHTIATNAGFTN